MVKKKILFVFAFVVLVLVGYFVWNRVSYDSSEVIGINDFGGSFVDVVNESGFENLSDMDFVNDSWWVPVVNSSWQWQLQGDLNLSYDVDVYDIDLFDTSKGVIDSLHDRGIRVICYFSAGSFEDWRVDGGNFPDEVLGNGLEGWEGERWLDVSKFNLFGDVMEARLDLAVEKGCDGVEPDNVDGYSNDNGVGFSYSDQLSYNMWIADEAHRRGLGVGLKNDLEQIKDLVKNFDFAVNEQCFEYDECELLLPFVESGKAVFGVEYELGLKDFCEEANNFGFSWLKMDYDLDGGREGC